MGLHFSQAEHQSITRSQSRKKRPMNITQTAGTSGGVPVQRGASETAIGFLPSVCVLSRDSNLLPPQTSLPAPLSGHPPIYRSEGRPGDRARARHVVDVDAEPIEHRRAPPSERRAMEPPDGHRRAGEGRGEQRLLEPRRPARVRRPAGRAGRRSARRLGRRARRDRRGGPLRSLRPRRPRSHGGRLRRPARGLPPRLPHDRFDGGLRQDLGANQARTRPKASHTARPIPVKTGRSTARRGTTRTNQATRGLSAARGLPSWPR